MKMTNSPENFKLKNNELVCHPMNKLSNETLENNKKTS